MIHNVNKIQVKLRIISNSVYGIKRPVVQIRIIIEVVLTAKTKQIIV